MWPTHQLKDMTWPEARDILNGAPLGLLPVGAIEAHGPHLPLETDIIIAEATARRAAERLAESNVHCVILPSVSYSVSFAGTSFPGTLPADPDAFERYICSILQHAVSQGYRALICCNAHLEPAHVERLQSACRSVEASSGIPVRAPDQRLLPFSDLLSDEFRAGARHAGSYETSIVLAAKPQAVRTEFLNDLPPVWIDLPAKLREGARTFAEAGADQGYFGDPAKATIEEGHRMLDALAEMIVLTVNEIDTEGRDAP